MAGAQRDGLWRHCMGGMDGRGEDSAGCSRDGDALRRYRPEGRQQLIPHLRERKPPVYPCSCHRAHRLSRMVPASETS